MTIEHTGYVILTWAWVLGTAATDSVIVVSASIGALVALSTIMIRISSLIENRVITTINRLQSSGELPTQSQWLHVENLLEELRDELRNHQ